MMKPCSSIWIALLCLLGLSASGCRPAGESDPSGSGERQLVVGVAFETLQTEYWVAGFDAIKGALRQKNIRVLEAIADGDSNRQFEQIRNFVTRRVDGIIMVPKDAKTCIPAIRAANAANIPIVLFNRIADRTDAKFVGIQADNVKLARETVAFMVEEARRLGGKRQAMLVMGDLGDLNAIGRHEGFEQALRGNEDIVEVVARVPTEWSQEKAQAGVVNALQANPQIGFIFTGSDFLFPSIISALRQKDKYHKIGEPGHVILGGFDGDATAWQMMEEGYLDATGVQDVYFEAETAVQAILDLLAGEEPPELIRDPGFVIHQANKAEMKDRMWGARIAPPGE